MMEMNQYQTPLTPELLLDIPQEVQDQLFDILNNVEFVKRLVSPDRQYAKDRPRDDKGRIIVDLANPHILQDMDYFRPTALHYKKYGTLTNLRPNANPNSEFGKWIREERRRCWEGYVRESDGEWITGYMYFYLNYCPIILSRIREGSKKADRVVDFPEVWEGIYWRFHYIDQMRNGGLYNDFKGGNHGAELARRGASKSYSLGSIAAHNFILGENEIANQKINTVVTAYQKEYLTKDGTLNKFLSMADFCAEHTQFPRKRLKSSLQDMIWTMGYKDLETNVEKGTLNSVLGVSSKDDESKMRGKRAHILVDEFGTFARLIDAYNVWIPSVQEGDIVFAMIYMCGTAGDDQSDFAGAQEIMYNPKGYNMYALPNVFDKVNQGKKDFVFFFPGYINRKGCYNKDGVSDVIKALIEILLNRYKVKYNSTDPNTVVKTIAEIPITPSEAIIKTGVNMFPITDLTERLGQIDSNPREYDDTYVGDLILKNGDVEFSPSTQAPIREFPHKDNKIEGAIEMFQLPVIDPKNKKPFQNRYIAGCDPYDDDEANTMSLGSIFIMDLWTDKVVAEYTGRPMFAEDFYEICRKLCLFYDARLNYEAHPYDQIVRLPNGETKLWKDIKIGDKLFSPTGSQVTVVDIPIEGEDDIYRITLQDGRQVEASSNHIWNVYLNNHPNIAVNITTKQMVDKGVLNKFNQKNFFIPQCRAVEYNHTDVPIDPYTLGLLIAEGAFTKFRKTKYKNNLRRTVQFSSSIEDGRVYSKILPYQIKHIGTKGYSWHMYIDNVDNILSELGLLHCNSHAKFIPQSYLINDYTTRLELLKGLMDGDGCATNGANVFVTVSKRLADDVALLCRSLGMKVTLYQKEKCYRVAIATNTIIFKLPRKVAKQHIYKPQTKGSKAASLLYKTAIIDIQYVGKKKCKCVTVDSQDGLYLIGDYIVTHNCNKKGLFSYFSKMNCTYLLTDQLDFLKDKDLIKPSYGNKAKGVTATLPINAFAKNLLRAWLLKPVPIIKTVDGEEQEVQVPNLYTLKNRALIKELIAYNSEGNFDRISAMGMLMLLREDKLILYNGAVTREKFEKNSSSYLGNDPFFKKNYDDRLSKFSKKSLV